MSNVLDFTVAPLPLLAEWLRVARDPEKRLVSQYGRFAFESASRTVQHGRECMLLIAGAIAGARSVAEAAKIHRQNLTQILAVCSDLLEKFENGKDAMAAELPATASALEEIAVSLALMRSAVSELLRAFDDGRETRILKAAVLCSKRARIEATVGGSSVN